MVLTSHHYQYRATKGTTYPSSLSNLSLLWGSQIRIVAVVAVLWQANLADSREVVLSWNKWCSFRNGLVLGMKMWLPFWDIFWGSWAQWHKELNPARWGETLSAGRSGQGSAAAAAAKSAICWGEYLVHATFNELPFLLRIVLQNTSNTLEMVPGITCPPK